MPLKLQEKEREWKMTEWDLKTLEMFEEKFV